MPSKIINLWFHRKTHFFHIGSMKNLNLKTNAYIYHLRVPRLRKTAKKILRLCKTAPKNSKRNIQVKYIVDRNGFEPTRCL